MTIDLISINLGDTVFFTTTNRLGELDVGSGEVEEKNERASGVHSVVLKIQEEGMDDFFHSRSFFVTSIFNTAEEAVETLESDIVEIETKHVASLAKVKVKFDMVAVNPVLDKKVR